MNELLKCRRVYVSKAVFTEISSSKKFLNFPTENITNLISKCFLLKSLFVGITDL